MLDFQYIRPNHQEIIEKFDCSDEITVERFLKELSLKHHLLRSSVTRLYFDGDQNLVGYFTLHNDLVHVHPNQIKKNNWNLPEEHDFFPAVKLHYLGVDKQHRGKGYGEFMLIDAIQSIEQLAKTTGCTFITIESLRSAIPFYVSYGFQIRQRGKEFDNLALKLAEII